MEERSSTVSPRVLLISGSGREELRLKHMLEIVRKSAATAGAKTQVLELHDLNLPIMNPNDRSQSDLESVSSLREAVARADALVIGTPEYHGTMSGVLKNAFDFLYGELAGKVVSVVATTGGGGGDMSITAVKTSCSWCHAFPLPFHCAAKSSDFGDGELENPKVRERLVRMGRDTVHYTIPLRDAFAKAKKMGEGPESGFAGLHIR